MVGINWQWEFNNMLKLPERAGNVFIYWFIMCSVTGKGNNTVQTCCKFAQYIAGKSVWGRYQGNIAYFNKKQQTSYSCKLFYKLWRCRDKRLFLAIEIIWYTVMYAHEGKCKWNNHYKILTSFFHEYLACDKAAVCEKQDRYNTWYQNRNAQPCKKPFIRWWWCGEFRHWYWKSAAG